MLKIDGHDDAIVGQACVWVQGKGGMSREDVLIYSGQEILEMLVGRDGMDWDEAREFIEFNIEGAYMGPDTPIVMWEPGLTE
jgi:hypothetical protein